MFNLATLFVNIKADTGNFEKGLGGVKNKLTTANVAAGTFIGNVASGMARAAVGMGGGLFDKTIKSAMNFNEATSKSEAVFAGAAKGIISNTEMMADSYGISKQKLLDGTTVIGQLAKGAGMGGEAAAKFGTDFANLAAQAESFNNVPLEQSLQKIRSGLSGEAEPLKDFGIFMTESTMKAEAMAMGLGNNIQALTEQQKVSVRASIISKGLADANGDLERTFMGTTNQTRLFWGTLENLGMSIGQTLLPAWDLVISGANAVMQSLKGFFDSSKESAGGWVTSLVENLKLIGVAWRNFGDITEIALLTAARMWVEFSSSIQSVAGAIGSYLLMPAEVMVNAFVAAVETVGSLWDALMEQMASGVDFLLRPIRDLTNALGLTTGSVEEDFQGMKGAFSAPAEGAKQFGQSIREMRANLADAGSGGASELAGIDAQIAAIQDRMANREIARTAETAKPKTDAQLMAESMGRTSRSEDAGSNAGDAAKDFKSEIMSSADFAAKLRQAQGGEDIPQKQLTVLEQMREQDKDNGEMLAKIADNAFGMVLA